MISRVAKGRLQIRQIYRLLQWIHIGDKVQIRKMLKLGVQNLINLTEPRDGTGVLHVAVSANNEDMTRFLLSLGANPDIQNKRGCTAVMIAAELGVLFYCMYPTQNHAHCLQVALNYHADVNNVSQEGNHVFQMMCERAHECTPTCLTMLDEGANPDATNEQTKVTALMEAAKAGSVQLVRAILRKGGNPNALDMNRLSAAHYAAMGSFLEVMLLLSAFSANMGVMDMEDCTPLHFAAVTGDLNCCKFLAQRGCNPKIRNQEGLLPRQITKNMGHKAAAKELKKAERRQGKTCNVDKLMSDVWALTLHDWSYEFRDEILEAFEDSLDEVEPETFLSVLQELNAPVTEKQLNVVTSTHSTRREPLININDFIKGVKYIRKQFLISLFLPKKKKTQKERKVAKRRNNFVLTLPVCTLSPEVMPRRPDGGPPQFMIEAIFRFLDRRGFTSDNPPQHPLMIDSEWYIERPNKVFISINYCVKSGDQESLDFAFSHGVPVDVKDPFYKTPLMVACSSGNYEVAEYLLSKRADVTQRDQFLWTPLHHAAFAGQVELVKLLVKAGASINALSLNRGTPLMNAVLSSRPSCVDALIHAGANVAAENKRGHSALDIAHASGDSTIIDLVKEKMNSLPKPNETKGKKKPKQVNSPKKSLDDKLVFYAFFFLTFKC
ncbi:ankyrin repeat and EF-hand domain-containing protein 1 isoform X2 [Nelusetta ayraudi]|uniref:ankyrin repeat and EF-hand domain-containing protein 1 isoform X2 n=1 Tax=Nelusetta ayraudi TaxID=303726 RepID=UPI003F71F20B